ncbi:nitroreductase family protein [Candidatus Xianfuyuplasma coldseepsis]|uniref:Putative nitroreductase TM1586 domain-containing protein n=1 Tax=Candidatus Xianfuyuplasma coldseepsis TaxID=2782163 RepID=A0A7L7KR28_9MOLU|nr:nitroreductase family protein [Xianfuyuplasma coldseepsis]QMS85280.1 hypothetical protein G4Z02_05790 [Xianfuyuplasma coldseepsis]
MEKNKSFFTIIEERTSVRSYENKQLSNQDRTKITEILEEYQQQTPPFGHSVRFFLVDNGTTRQTKIGTYGFIKNPPSFIGGVVHNSIEGMVDFGFLMEQVILRLTELGFGTVWLGGTYHRKNFDVRVDDGEIIAAVSPVGYGTSRSLRERVIRWGAKGDQRRPFDMLFFLGNPVRPVPIDHIYYKYLEAVRLAPSASNKQPWRILLIERVFHLYLERTPNYGNLLVFDIQRVDIGIALSHLYLTLVEDGYQVKIVKDDPTIDTKWEYVISLVVTSNISV